MSLRNLWSLDVVNVLFFWPIYSSLAVGCKSGYRLFSLNSVDKLEQIYENGRWHFSIRFF